MKKILLTIGLIASSLGMRAQLEVVFADTNVVGNAYNTVDLAAHIHIKNNGSSAKNIKARRVDKNYTALTDSNAICWGLSCYPPSVSVSLGTEQIAPGATSTAFSAHVYPDKDGIPQSGSITYVFFDELNSSDSVQMTINYTVNQTFSIQSEIYKSTVKVFPNPASDKLKVSYDLPVQGASFEIVSVLGNRVYQKNLTERKGELDLNVSRLAKGVYFYTVKEPGGKVLATRKLVIE